MRVIKTYSDGSELTVGKLAVAVKEKYDNWSLNRLLKKQGYY